MPPRTPIAALTAASLAACLTPGAAAQTAQTSADGAKLYENEVHPILEANCLECHGRDPAKLRGGFALTSRVGVLRGGELGPAIDPASPDRSLILRAISYRDDQLQMPPDGKLADADIETLRDWINLGAPFGGDEDDLDEIPIEARAFVIPDSERAWWSYQPLERPVVPEVRDADWPANDLDRLVLAGIEDAGLEPARDADRRTLIRRATYDLTGIPPTPEAVAAFVRDPDPRAYEKLVDSLLASPQYGVRWGRHWLDLVRFAETDSYERDRLKPGAWRYRDWVIDALNADMPYDAFLTAQLAGDELDDVTADALVATGYLRLGIWDDEPTDLEQAQYDDLDSVLDTTCRVMLGVSMGCARCHDHKGDPIPQADYYRMLSFFRGIAPYKAQLGNATTPENYVDRIPADLGDERAERARVAYATARADAVADLRTLRDAAHASAGSDAVSAAMAERDRGLVAHLPLDETTALVAIDAAGTSHARLNDANMTVGVPGADGVDGGTAYRFDGRDDWLGLPRPVAGDFTLAIWFRTDAGARAPGGSDLRWFRGEGLIDGEISGIVPDFGLSLVGDGHVTGGTGAPETFVASGSGYNDGRWHHAAMTRERSTGHVRLYVDGRRVHEAVGSIAALDAPPMLTVGRIQAGGGHFRGDLDDVRIYGRALDDDEVLDLFIGGASAAPFRRLADGDRLAAAIDRYRALEPPTREMIEVLRVKEVGAQAPDTHVLIRGNPHAPAAPVAPGFPRILDETAPDVVARPDAPDVVGPTTGRRRALAAWITDPDNVRTARVMANRIWQHHFGVPIVPTPNDFGKLGLEPTHPALLDWLAAEFVDGGWSLKHLHRVIMLSHAYRMSSTPSDRATEMDPENLAYARFPMRRLAAEEIRDSILAVTGTLNLEMGGPGVYPEMPEEVLATSSRPDEAWGRSDAEQAARRSVYIHLKRSLLVPFLETFDMADTDATCPVRFVTTQPTQALTMLNSNFMQEQARLLARRLRRDTDGTARACIARAIELATTRPPLDVEIDEGLALLDDLRTEGLDAGEALAAYCLLVLNLNEFVYLD